jgi:thiamine-phosphate pyrophosphorylase
VFEAPCVAYAASLDEVAPLMKAGADFIALGDWLWRDPQAVAATVAQAAGRLRLPESAA